jgi:dihydrofolate reductase
MRKLMYMTSMSLDGYIEASSGDSRWMMPDEELHRHFNDVESTVDTQLYGRRMYELMTQFWPTADQNPSAPSYIVEYARFWKRVAKVVFSTTLQGVNWNARPVKGDPLTEVAGLKEQSGGNLSIGGTALASALADDGLIDEYRLYVVPVVLGRGTPILRAVRARINLEFAEVRTFTMASSKNNTDARVLTIFQWRYWPKDDLFCGTSQISMAVD